MLTINVYKSCFIDTGLSGYSRYVYALEYKEILLTDFAIKCFTPNLFLKRLCEIKCKNLEENKKK